MAKQNHPDERVVYLTLKNVFKGPQAENGKQQDVADLIRAHNLDIICNTARSLLAEQIFESTLKAKIRFPELFDVSPAQSAERAASEAEAARNDANAIKDAGQGLRENGVDANQIEEAVETESVETFKDPTPLTTKRSQNIPSLFPVYLPLRTQHHLLVRIQTILELACFNFGQQVMPEVLRKNRWDCPESAELNLWAVEFSQHQSEFADKKNHIGKPIEKLFRSVSDIRHAAVHRIRVSAKGLELFIADAESLASLLDDSVCLDSLTTLRRRTQLAIEELERTKHILHSKLEETLRDIAARRAELDRLEEMSISEMIKEDEAYQAFAGTNLEEAIMSFEAITLTASTTEIETSSGLDDNDGVED